MFFLRELLLHGIYLTKCHVSEMIDFIRGCERESILHQEVHGQRDLLISEKTNFHILVNLLAKFSKVVLVWPICLS